MGKYSYVLPVSLFSPCDAPGTSRYPHPEGEPCIYNGVFFLEDTDWRGVFVSPGLSIGLLKVEFLGQIASFERRLRWAAPIPLALPYQPRNWPGSGMGAEGD